MQDKEREVVCITGSTGFVGRHIAHELCSRGLKVRCVARPTSDLTPLVGLDIDVVVPAEDEQATVHNIIYEELCRGKIGDASRRACLKIIEVLTELLKNIER